MKYREPFNQTKLFGLDKFINELIHLYNLSKLPNKILLSGQKGLGKSTLAYHFINFVLSKNEDFSYDISKFEINEENHSYKTILNKSNPNLISINLNLDSKTIDINQIRELISILNKSFLSILTYFITFPTLVIVELEASGNKGLSTQPQTSFI